MHWTFYIVYITLGCGIGCFAGLLGLGGGLVVVPVLNWIFKWQTETASNSMHMAIATSLAVMVVTSITAASSHSKKEAVLWKVFIWIGLGMLLGATIGPIISDGLKSRFLEIVFGIVELSIALFVLFFNKKQKAHKGLKNIALKRFLCILVGCFSAGLGSMLGIGGGVIIVPFLLFLGISAQKAVGTSSATTMVTAIIGTISQLLLSYEISNPYSIGYIYLPAAIALALGSLICAPLGVKLAHKMPERHLKIIFVFVLVGFGLIMIV